MHAEIVTRWNCPLGSFSGCPNSRPVDTKRRKFRNSADAPLLQWCCNGEQNRTIAQSKQLI